MPTEVTKTRRIRHALCVLLVGLPDDAATACTRATSPMPNVRASSLADGLEKMVATHPLLVVLSKDESGDDTELWARARDVGSAVLIVSPRDPDIGAKVRKALDGTVDNTPDDETSE